MQDTTQHDENCFVATLSVKKSTIKNWFIHSTATAITYLIGIFIGILICFMPWALLFFW